MQPITYIINPEVLSHKEKFSRLFKEAQPCKHVAIENFLNPEVADQLFENFPPFETLNVKRKSINEDKAEDYHFERWHPIFSQVRDAVQSEEFCTWLSEMTGVEGLRSTDDSLGSGLHQGKNGSFVDVHVDVNMNPEKGLWRRINLLIYLNKYWKPEYGGDLELWDVDMKNCIKKIPPYHNVAVIFYTDDNSPHGYSRIHVPEHESRKSFYTYYYTPIGEGFTYRDSKFLPRPDESLGKKLITNVKETIKINTKRALKFLGVKKLDFQDKN
ncbi:MAG: 2OG-Fe(II) oxygenase [Thermaurantimonas sp.]|uniref:2OG-Fe(II) oxygenase n=1 Tax=Thermaurantimonas sp. TaxID=2681568 RepID=UPI0039189C56